MLRALASIVAMPVQEMGDSEIYVPLFDYYDDPGQRDPRLPMSYERLSLAAEVFSHDLVNLSVYAHQVLDLVREVRDPTVRGPAVVTVGALAEAYISSIRCACDALAIGLAHAASEKPGQAPGESLRKLLQWAEKHPQRIRPEVRRVLGAETEWFWGLRSLRDDLIHRGTRPNVYFDTKEFHLWPTEPGGRRTAELPLLPLMGSLLRNLLGLANAASAAIRKVFPLPADRQGSRALASVFVHSLKRLDQLTQPPRRRGRR